MTDGEDAVGGGVRASRVEDAVAANATATAATHAHAMPAAAPPAHAIERAWVEASVRSVRAEAALYRATMRAFLGSPKVFVREWQAGTREFMNPLGFLALSVLVLGAVRSFGWWYLERQGSEFAAQLAGEQPFWAELWGALGPSLHFAVLGLICHHTLRLLGNHRVPASSSAAMTFYAAGSAGLVGEAAVWELVLGFLTVGVIPLEVVYSPLFAGFGIALSVFCAYLGYTLGALHLPRWWHMLLAFAAAFFITGLFFGHVDPPGDYGIRWFLRVWADGHPTFSLQLRL